MWWWSGYPWLWFGPVLMAVFMVVCMAVMALMMGRGRMPACMGVMRGFWGQRSGRHETGTSGQILDERLARGEIDIKEYRRIQETFAETNGPAGGQQVGSQR
jgi:uncharacterized membrane protein